MIYHASLSLSAGILPCHLLSVSICMQCSVYTGQLVLHLSALWSENSTGKTLKQTQRARARTVWSRFMCSVCCVELNTHSLRLCSAPCKLKTARSYILLLVEMCSPYIESGRKHESILRYPTRSVSYFRILYLASVAFQNPIVLIIQYVEVWYFLSLLAFFFCPFALFKSFFLFSFIWDLFFVVVEGQLLVWLQMQFLSMIDNWVELQGSYLLSIKLFKNTFKMHFIHTMTEYTSSMISLEEVYKIYKNILTKPLHFLFEKPLSSNSE